MKKWMAMPVLFGWGLTACALGPNGESDVGAAPTGPNCANPDNLPGECWGSTGGGPGAGGSVGAGGTGAGTGGFVAVGGAAGAGTAGTADSGGYGTGGGDTAVGGSVGTGGSPAAGGSDSVGGSFAVGGSDAVGGSFAVGGGPDAVGGSGAIGGAGSGGAAEGGVEPNLCSNDVARCFDAAEACFENSPWSDCDSIVRVCAQMEDQCSHEDEAAGSGGYGGSESAGSGGHPAGGPSAGIAGTQPR